MPEHIHPSGMVDFVDMNKDSTHPNRWRPPQPIDQFCGRYHASYQIYHHPKAATIFRSDPTKNMAKDGSITSRMITWGARGFAVGCFFSYVDIMFFTQSISWKTNVARFLYITPPTTVLGPAYIVTREITSSFAGQDKMWPYVASSLAPAGLWGTFRGCMRSGITCFGLFSIIGLTAFYNEITGGMFWTEDKKGANLERDMQLPNMHQKYERTSTWMADRDPGKYYAQYTEKPEK